MRMWMQNHFLAVLFALFCGAMLVVPFAIFHYQHNGDDSVIYPYFSDNEYFYVSRIQEVLDGHPFIGNAYFVEHKAGLPQQVFLAEFLLALPLKLFHLSAYDGRMLWSGPLGVAIFLLTYVLFYLTSKNKLVSLGVTISLICGMWFKLIERPVSPQFNIIFLLSCLIFLWKMVEEPGRRWWVFAGLNLGFLFYIYPYYWNYLVITLGILFALSLLSKRSDQASAVFRVLLVAGFVSLPYWYLTWQASQLAEYIETLIRIGMVYSHFPSGIKVVIGSFAGLGVLMIFGKEEVRARTPHILFCIALLLGSIVAVNQHVITGQNFQFSNHFNQTTTIALAITALYVLRRFWNISVSKTIFTLGVIAGVYGSMLFIVETRAFVHKVASQRYAPTLHWLQKQTPRDSVVFADAELSEMIPAFTHNNVYHAPSSVLFFIPDRELVERYLINNYFENVDENKVHDDINLMYGTGFATRLSHVNQRDYARLLLGLSIKRQVYIPKEIILGVLDEMQRIHKLPFEQAIKTYRVEYLVWDREKYPAWKIAQQPFLHLEFEDTVHNLLVYSVVQ